MVIVSDPQSLETGELLSLLELLDAAVVEVDLVSGVVRWVGGRSEGLAELGAPGPIPLGACFPEASARAALEAVEKDGRARSLEHPLHPPGRGERWFRTSVLLVERPQTRQLLAVMVDITTSKHNERQWRELEAWLATLAETLPFDFWICAPDGRCALQNPASLDHWGPALGLRIEEMELPAAWKESWARCFPKALVGEQLREEVSYEVAGQRRTFSRVAAPVYGGAGVLCVDLDITDLTRTAERLQRSLAELKQAQESLVRRSQLAALGEMAAVVAHEVRNPLGSISNALALLRRRAQLTEQDQSLCSIIGIEVQRLDGLVAHLLDFVRPLTIVLGPAPLSGVVDEALAQTLRADATASALRIVRRYDEALEPVMMDARLLGLALSNLFRNAVQALAGKGTLEVVVERAPEATPAWVRVTIRDDGPGIPAQVKNRIFEPFVTTRQTGSGLGLTIVRRVVEEHGGRFELLSEEARGTTCVVELPAGARP